jgi:hypothetical protein
MLESDRTLQHPIENSTAEVHVGSDWISIRCQSDSNTRDPLVSLRLGFQSDTIRSDRFRCRIHSPGELSFYCTIINISGINSCAKALAGISDLNLLHLA